MNHPNRQTPTAAAHTKDHPNAGRISIRNVTKIYDPDGANVLALDNCSLEIEAGEFCVIVGPSGCGKTTLLNAIAGFHDISSGQIDLDGQPLCTAKRMAEPGADRIVVFQQGALFPWYTVLENIVYGPEVQGKCPKPRPDSRRNPSSPRWGSRGSTTVTPTRYPPA